MINNKTDVGNGFSFNLGDPGSKKQYFDPYVDYNIDDFSQASNIGLKDPMLNLNNQILKNPQYFSSNSKIPIKASLKNNYNNPYSNKRTITNKKSRNANAQAFVPKTEDWRCIINKSFNGNKLAGRRVS